MVVKKQLKKISKKILVLGLATSIIFTSCFSTKKIDAHATSVAAGLGSYTLYEICLYIGGVVATTLGIGYVYENRDDIAEFGKNVIDNMTNLPALGWIMGSSTVNGDYVYGTEALQEVKDTQWTVIQGGGQSPKNDNDNDGDKDEDDRTIELNLNKMFLTSAGVSLLKEKIYPMYEAWINNNTGVFSEHFGSLNINNFDGYRQDSNSYYVGYLKITLNGEVKYDNEIKCTKPFGLLVFPDLNGKYRMAFRGKNGCSFIKGGSTSFTFYPDDVISLEMRDIPFIYTDSATDSKFCSDLSFYPEWQNYRNAFRIADWIADDNAWAGHLEDIAFSLRSLQDLTLITQQLCDNTLNLQPTLDAYKDLLDDYANNQYVPSTDPITEPQYYPLTNPTPQLAPSEFPNYVPSGGDTDTPSDGGGSDEEIDLDGLGNIFSILFYLIMIIIMLIYLFLACLSFIVMIFRIPPSSAMLPEEMVMGFDHLKTIMIPGMNISIYGFAMALIYLLIIFTVIKILRLEINDFKFPRAGRKP